MTMSESPCSYPPECNLNHAVVRQHGHTMLEKDVFNFRMPSLVQVTYKLQRLTKRA